jgi:hypothetical protein
MSCTGVVASLEWVLKVLREATLVYSLVVLLAVSVALLLREQYLGALAASVGGIVFTKLLLEQARVYFEQRQQTGSDDSEWAALHYRVRR